jgi:hypothetical protein
LISSQRDVVDLRADAGEGLVGDGVVLLVRTLTMSLPPSLMRIWVIFGISMVPPLVVSSRSEW